MFVLKDRDGKRLYWIVCLLGLCLLTGNWVINKKVPNPPHSSVPSDQCVTILGLQNPKGKPIFVSYAQLCEDLILYNMLHEVSEGFYIDVGANNPFVDSATYFFYVMGWHGINIEPLESEYHQLLKHRPRDINLNIGVGAQEGRLLFYEKGGLSTLKQEVVDRWTDKPAPKEIKVLPLSTICDRYCKDEKIIHFLKIDVEEFEKEVLLGADFHRFRPRIIVIEATKPLSSTPTHQSWEYILLDNNYQFVLQHKVNRYYVDRAYPYLLTRNQTVEQLEQHYLILHS